MIQDITNSLNTLENSVRNAIKVEELEKALRRIPIKYQETEADRRHREFQKRMDDFKEFNHIDEED